MKVKPVIEAAKDTLNQHRYLLMALLSGLILLGSGISLGIGLSGRRESEVEVKNIAPISGVQTVSELTDREIQGKININLALAAELDLLPGIGPVYAQRIIDYRKKNGPFKTIAEIEEVSGIGPKTFAKIKDLITVRD